MASNSVTELYLPPGFRFHPTEIEIFQHYLIPKLKGEPLPPGFLIEIDVYKHDPEQLPFDELKYAREKEGYFFLERSSEDSLPRMTPNGYWKVSEENIIVNGEDGIIGFKNKLFFSKGSYPNGDETEWRITEYICTTVTPTTKNWIVCKARLKIKVEEDLE